MIKDLSFFVILLLLLFSTHENSHVEASLEFVKTSGLNFVVNGKPFFANGFNAYWLMTYASDPTLRSKVTTAFSDASTNSLSVARTWAFSDGGNNALQYAPGSYNEQTFQALDFVVAEAAKYNIRLILSLVNNYDSFGGRKQYVQWARDAGQNVASDDEFYTNSVVKSYYKNNVQTMLTRVNTITGVAYKDDPTIFAWELINEPRCSSDSSGNSIQAWITEMAAHVKSIDSNHLLEIGSEGFYGESSSEKQANPTNITVGTDFIANNQIPGIDFATIHTYPDQWLSAMDEESQLLFLNSWLDIHFQDAKDVLYKPLLATEFGKSSKDPAFNDSQRDDFFNAVYSKIYSSASSGGAAAGALFWHLLTEGMDSLKDGYEIIFDQVPSTTKLVKAQSQHLGSIGQPSTGPQHIKKGEKQGK